MAKKLHGGANTKVVDAFHAVDLGAPFKVILTNSVSASFDTETGEMLSYTIPDFEELVRSVAMSRLTHDRKLSGAELQFLRKAVSVSQAELARVLDCKADHLSKVENGRYPLTTMAERWARIFLFKKAAKLHNMEDGKMKNKVHQLLDQMFHGLKPVAVFSDEELEFSFHYKPRDESSSDSIAANDDWVEADANHTWSDGQELQAACG
jgi:DNA-binding transcriptional regulator YiaG